MTKHAANAALLAAGAVTAVTPSASAQVNGGVERDGVRCEGAFCWGDRRRMAFNVGLDLHPTVFLGNRGGIFAAVLMIGVELSDEAHARRFSTQMS